MEKRLWRTFRRPRVWMTVAGLILVAVSGYAWWAVARSRRPNVLLVTLDTTRADRLGCYGYPAALTPSLDALASEGVMFERAYTPVPMTLPAHASIMSGLLPPEHGLMTNGRGRLDESISVLAEVFRDAGYDTAGFVASFVLHSTFGLQRGFAVYDDDMTHTDPTEHGLHRQREGRHVVDAAMSWLQQPRRGPFFCWVHLYDAHEPRLTHSDEFGDRFLNSPYDGEIAYVDQQVGRLVKQLESCGLRERTLIVVIGDHGEGLGDHDENEHGLTIYNSVLQVPWIWAGRGVVAASRRVRQPVSLVDLRPTLLATTGLRDPARTSGRSLQAALAGSALAERACYAGTDVPLLDHGWSPLRCLLTSDWKYIRSTEVELYNLSTDPQEAHNLATTDPDRIAAMEEQLATLEQTIIPRQGAAVELSPSQIRALTSLRYLASQSSPPPTQEGTPLPDVKRMLPVYNRVDAAQRLMSDKGDVAGAETQLRAIVREVPEYLPAQNLLAVALARQRNLSGSREVLDDVLKLDPDNADAHFQVGSIFWENQQYVEAAAEFRRALAVNPYAEGAAFALGQTLLRLGQAEEAKQMYRQVLEYDPIHVNARVALANLLAAQNHLTEAESQYRAALQYDPALVEAHDRLAVLLVSCKRLTEAGEHFRRALELAPNRAELRFNYGTFLLAQGRFDEAITELETALALNPADPETKARLQQARTLRER
jgi:arylsulfatase A-like enzyme/Tfp pilus assembly protein PilF